MAIEFESAPKAPPGKGGVRSAPRFDWNMQLGPKAFSATDRMLFTERVELLLETGVSLAEALGAMKAQTVEPRMAALMASLMATVQAGQSFSAALARHPEMFPQTYVSLVAAAEQGGFLPQVLQQLREMDEKNAQMRGALISALSYPAFLILFSFAVVIFVLVVIFPQFHDLFESIRDQLPMPTVVLMFLSGLLRNHWLPALVATGAGLGGLVFWLRTPAGTQLMDRLKMGTPVVRDIFIQAYLYQTLSVLGMSLANGVPITAALKAAQEVVRNSVFARFQQTILRNVEQGRGIAVGFEEADFIPPMVRQMISTGEQTGNLAKVMRRVADFYARELAKRLAAFSRAVEPIMLMVMGVVVGLIVAALILPIFKLSRAVH